MLVGGETDPKFVVRWYEQNKYSTKPDRSVETTLLPGPKRAQIKISQALTRTINRTKTPYRDQRKNTIEQAIRDIRRKKVSGPEGILAKLLNFIQTR